jgi:hypothetical protein
MIDSAVRVKERERLQGIRGHPGACDEHDHRRRLS